MAIETCSGPIKLCVERVSHPISRLIFSGLHGKGLMPDWLFAGWVWFGLRDNEDLHTLSFWLFTAKKKQEKESKDGDLHQRGDKPHGPPPMALQALVILEVIPSSSIYNIWASTTTYINFDNGFFTEKTHGAPALTIQLQIVIPIFSSPSICARKKLRGTHKIRFTLSSKNDKYNRKVRLVFFQLVLQRVYLQYVYIFYRTLVFYWNLNG